MTKHDVNTVASKLIVYKKTITFLTHQLIKSYSIIYALNLKNKELVEQIHELLNTHK